jgi:plastocyanin
MRWIAAMLGVVLVVAAVGCGQNAEEGQDAADTAREVADEAEDAARQAADEAGDVADRAEDLADDVPVKIVDTSFQPDRVEIEIGREVTWVNEDSFAHTVTADNDAFDSLEIGADKEFSHRFTQGGEYPYHCNIHTSMKATVVVT